MSDAEPSRESVRLIAAYNHALAVEVGAYFAVTLVAMVAGSPNSKTRAAFLAMLASLDADLAKWSANETYREAMMKD